ncbi:uncharacterized protein [Primulina huaijiensis]|uniref:uncharacterized protein n=1 Tax=Primulina huaijiensis TaxID=1492673 RepID=UPI003CC737A5
MAHTRRTNQDTSWAHADNARTSGQGGGVPLGGTNHITITPEDLVRMISEAVEKAMARRESSHQVTPPGGGQENEQEQELREEGSPDESLRAYIRRFNRVALDVPTCATETKTAAFTQGLREGEFFKSLTKKVSGDFEDLLSRAEKYINMEEAQKEVQECSRDLAPDHQLPRPKKRGFCTLHKVCYHNTEDCKTLKGNYALPSAPESSQANKRLRLPWTSQQPGSSARGGNVRNNSRSDLGRKRAQEPERKKTSPPAMGLIKMISGGSTDGDSNRARKSRSRRECMKVEGTRRSEAVISFGPEDLKGVNLPHNDALVIQAQVTNYDILKVVVDSDSSVNVIFKDAFVQIDLQGYHLEAVETALFGFVGHVVYPEGEIILPLTLDS